MFSIIMLFFVGLAAVIGTGSVLEAADSGRIHVPNFVYYGAALLLLVGALSFAIAAGALISEVIVWM